MKLPWRFEIADLRTVDEVATAIRDMWVRGAGCIGATAGFGMYIAALEAEKIERLSRAPRNQRTPAHRDATYRGESRLGRQPPARRVAGVRVRSRGGDRGPADGAGYCR